MSTYAEANAGVRWQAQMEEFLDSVRTLTSESLMVPSDAPAAGQRAALAQANATGALALAVALSGGDVEHALSGIAESVKEAAYAREV